MTTTPNNPEQRRQRVHPDEELELAGVPSNLTNPTEQAWEALGLAEFPIVTTAVKRPSVDTVEFTESSSRRGTTVNRRWAMVGSSEYGLPRLYDLDLYVALLVLAERHGYETRLVKATMYELCSIPRLTPGGATYARIRQGVRRFIHTGYSAQGVFWPEGSTQPIAVEEWHILAEARLLPSYQDPAIRDGLPPSYLLFGEKFLNILKREKRKAINLGLWGQLGTGLAKPLFHYLDTALYNRDRFEIGVYRLGNHIGQTIRYAPSHAIRKYETYLRRFVDLGFLHSFEFKKSRSEDDPYKVIVFPGPKARRSAGKPLQVSLPIETPQSAPERSRTRNSRHPDPDVLALNEHFQQACHGTALAGSLSRRQREAAAELLQVAGGDLPTAQYIVDYALAYARETAFDIQHIAGTLINGYPERAIAHRLEQQAAVARAAEDREALERRLQEREALEARGKTAWDELASEERDTHLAVARKSLQPFLERVSTERRAQWIQDTARYSFVRGFVGRELAQRTQPEG